MTIPNPSRPTIAHLRDGASVTQSPVQNRNDVLRDFLAEQNRSLRPEMYVRRILQLRFVRPRIDECMEVVDRNPVLIHDLPRDRVVGHDIHFVSISASFRYWRSAGPD